MARWCFTDGLQKDHANFSEQGWYNTLEEFDGLMETKKYEAQFDATSRRNGDTNMGYGEYEELKIISCQVCNGLFLIGEDSFGTGR